MFIEKRNAMPFIYQTCVESSSSGRYAPPGMRIDNPVSYSLDDWQQSIDTYLAHYPDSPEGLDKSTCLTYFAARGIESVFVKDDPHMPGLMIYDGQYPGMAKNFFCANDWSIYMNARWLARRAKYNPAKEIPFYTERHELLFFGTPGARAAVIAMEEAEHALDFLSGHLTGEESTGMKSRTDTLVQYDSRVPEFLALQQTRERMKSMPDIFSTASLKSIEDRIRAAQTFQHSSSFYLAF